MKQKTRRSAKQSHATESPETGSPPGFPGTLLHYLDRYDIIFLFIVLYLVYNTIDGVGLMSGDTAPASLLPLALLTNHNVYLDFATTYVTNPDFAYAFPFVQGHYVSRFPIVTPVLVTPVYALSGFLSTFIANPHRDIALFVLSKSAASFITALAGVFVYLSGKELFSRRTAILTTFIFAFATSTWAISSQALWQHGTVELLLAALVYLIIRNENAETPANIVLMGVLSGLFVFNRPPDSLLLIPVLFYIVWMHRAKIPCYLAGALLGGLPFVYYNYSVFGNFFGGYANNLSLFAVNADFFMHYLGLLIAPNVGLLIFCPVLLLSIAGYYVIFTKTDSPVRTLLLVSGPAILLEILLYSFFIPWVSSAEYCFGPRFLTGCVPVLCLFTGYFLEEWFGTGTTVHQGMEKMLVLVIVGGLVMVSLCIQFIGVFYYGYSSDANLVMNEERAWNVSDSMIVRSFTEGSTRIPGVSVYILPPLGPVFAHNF